MSSPQLSNVPSMLSAMESLNEGHDAAFCQCLRDVIAAPHQHARFVHMLSMLEHIGSRKIMLSQMNGDLGEDTLKHLAEETRHAYFFKREAEKMAGGELRGFAAADTLALTSARIYFAKLDALLTQDMRQKKDKSLAYLWVSLIVELRAIWVYQRYQAALLAAQHPLSLKSLMAEENQHLRQMAEDVVAAGLDIDRCLPSALAIEERLFGQIFAQIRREVRSDTEAA